MDWALMERHYNEHQMRKLILAQRFVKDGKYKQPNKMSRSFQLNAGQSAIASLNERTIYIKVSDAVNYTVYESNVELKELRLSLDLEDAYKIIVRCLEGSKGGYNVTTSVNTGIMKMSFSALVEGFLKINFDIILKEKIMSNDGQLTLSINRIEQKQAMAIEALTKKCADFEDSINKMQKIIDCCQIFMTNIYTPQGHWCDLESQAQTKLINISTKEMTLESGQHCVYRNIKSFYQLTKLTINNFTTKGNLSDFKNCILVELILNCGNGTFTSLQGIDGFPSLEILTITSAPGLKDVVKVLSDVKHNIKTLKFQGCTAINVVELQTYCQVNGIFLALS
jgi:hypothetical protein